jgi:hypothetical protein
VESVALPTPLDLEDVVAKERDPIFVSMGEPGEKNRPFSINGFNAIESRGTAGMVAQAGALGGFDLRRHPGMMIAGAVPKPDPADRGLMIGRCDPEYPHWEALMWIVLNAPVVL